MSNLFLILLLMASALSVKQGVPYEDAVRTVGCDPTFCYCQDAATPDSGWRFSRPMKFGVYGWDLDTAFYGMQTLNDTVVIFHKFDNRREYKQYVTPPSEIRKK